MEIPPLSRASLVGPQKIMGEKQPLSQAPGWRERTRVKVRVVNPVTSCTSVYPSADHPTVDSAAPLYLTHYKLGLMLRVDVQGPGASELLLWLCSMAMIPEASQALLPSSVSSWPGSLPPLLHFHPHHLSTPPEKSLLNLHHRASPRRGISVIILVKRLRRGSQRGSLSLSLCGARHGDRRGRPPCPE